MNRTLRKVLDLRFLGEVVESGEEGRMSTGVPDTGNSRSYRKFQSTKELCRKEIQEVSVAGTKQIREEAQDEQRHKPDWVELW